MKFVLTVETGNAAFTDGTGDLVLADAVANVAEMLRHGFTNGDVRDPNGPKVGSFTLTRDDDDTEDDNS